MGIAVGSGAASEDVFRVVGWIALGFGTAALILSVAGITMIRTRGETALAVLALVLTLAPTALAGPVIFVVWLVEFSRRTLRRARPARRRCRRRS